MRKIHVIRQFLEASGPQSQFFEKKPFLDGLRGLPNFRFLSFFVWSGGREETNPQTNIILYTTK